MVAKSINQILTKYSDKIIIFIFPILLAFINRNWIFTPATDFIPDPWFYFAYFRYFYAYAPIFPSNIHYFVERLTWNIPGYYIYQLFPPLQANYVLHLIVCYIALFSLYGILNTLFNRRTALLSALLLGSYPWFLRAVGWDYIDGAGIAQMLLLIYILTLASRAQQWKLHLFLAGMVHASLLITNLFWLGFALSWAVYFFALNYPISKAKARKLFGQTSYFMLGNLAMVVIVAIFYHSVTGNYFFLTNSITFSIKFGHDADLIQYAINLYKHMPVYWHVIPVLVSIGALSRLRRIKQDPYRKSFIAISLLFVAAYAWLIFGHFYSLPYLTIFLYSSFAIPAVFLLLGTLLASIVNNFSNRDFNIIVALAILVLASPYLLVVIFPSSVSWQGNLFLLLLFGLIFWICISLPIKRAVLLPFLLAFSALSFLGGLNAYVFQPNPLQGQENFLAIIDSSQAIDSYYPNHKYTDFRLWFREDENFNTFFDLSALYLYPWGSTIGQPLAGKKPDAVLSFSKKDALHNGDNIVIISSNPHADEVITEANLALADRNAVLVLKTSKEIKEGPLRFTLYFTKIKAPDNN